MICQASFSGGCCKPCHAQPSKSLTTVLRQDLPLTADKPCLNRRWTSPTKLQPTATCNLLGGLRASRLLHRLGEGVRRRVRLAQYRPTRWTASGEKTRCLAQQPFVEVVAEGQGDLRFGQGQGVRIGRLT